MLLFTGIMSFYDWFFLAKDRPPAGLFSFSHLFSVTLCLLIFLSLAYFFGRRFKFEPRKQTIVLIVAGISILLVQIAKLVFLYIAYNDDGKVWRFLVGNAPMYLCDMMIPIIPLAAITRGKVRRCLLDFIAIWGLLMGFMGNYFAGNIYLSNPAFCFISLVSLLNHSISAFTALFIFVSGMNKMEKRDMLWTVAILVLYMTAALVVDYVDNHNFMFFFDGDGTPFTLFKDLVKGNLVLYQIEIYILQCGYMVGFYFAYYGIVKAIKKHQEKVAALPSFDPKTNKFPYTEKTDQHYLKLKKDNGIIFDENYPYIDRSFGIRFKQFLVRVLLVLIVFPMTRIRLGLRIKGKDNIYRYRHELEKGCVSVCNHVHMWDYLSIMSAIRPFKPMILAWDKNLNGESAGLIRMVGGIPIPKGNPKATLKFSNEVNEYIRNGGWLHIYPEGSMWEYYQPIRPFKSGVSHFAIANDRPVMPLAISYRKPNWIRRKLFKQIACFTLTIGEPLYKDETLEREKQLDDLTLRARDAVCRLAHIKPEENLYPPLFSDNDRIDYYTKEYGIGYKGSH